MHLTKKQKTLLDFIDGFTKDQGYSPTLREITQALGYKSVSTVAKHVDNLVLAGRLIKRDGEARSLEVVHALALASTEEWWRQLEREAIRRERCQDATAQQQAAVLRQALEIVRPADATS